MIQLPSVLREPKRAIYARERKRKIAITAAIAVTVVAGACLIGAHANNGNICSTAGTFYSGMDAINQNGIKHKYYQFESTDGQVIWALTVEEIGFIPLENREYILTYDNNGTTKANKPCDCPPEYECECEVYDDIFLGVKVK